MPAAKSQQLLCQRGPPLAGVPDLLEVFTARIVHVEIDASEINKHYVPANEIARKLGLSKADNAAANAAIKKLNPEMTDALLAYSIAKMKEYGIVDSGDALTLGVGAMTDARMKSFYDKMVRAGVVKPSIALDKAYTLRFVNKKVGLDLRPKQ